MPPPGGSPATRRLLGGAGRVGPWYLLAGVMALIVIAPTLTYYRQAFADGGSPISGMLDNPRLGDVLKNTLLLAVGSTTVATVLALTMAAFVQRVPAKYRGWASIVPILPFIVPPVASITGWIFVFSPRVGYGNTFLRELPFFDHLTEGPVNVYSLPMMIIITGSELAGIVYTFVYPRMQELDGPLEAAARLSGASRLTTYRTVTLPLLRPSVIAGVVACFLLSLGQFTAPLLLGSRQGIDVLTTEIFRIRERFPIDYGATAAIGLPLLILGIAVILAQRFVIGDQRKYVTQTGGGRNAQSDTTPWALVVVLFYGFVAIVVPMAAVVIVAFSQFWSGDLAGTQFTLEHVKDALGSATVRDSIQASLLTSILAILIAIPLGFIGALAMTAPFKAPRFAQVLLDVSFGLPLAVPRAILGMVVLYIFLGPPFNLYGTLGIFVVGYLFVILPFSIRAQHGSLVGVSTSLYEAARIAGAGYFRTVFQIAMPLARKGMAAAGALMFILLSHDFAVSVMVRSPDTHVMGTLLYDFYSTGVYPQVAVMALIISVVTGAGVAASLLIGGRSALEKL